MFDISINQELYLSFVSNVMQIETIFVYAVKPAYR